MRIRICYLIVLVSGVYLGSPAHACLQYPGRIFLTLDNCIEDISSETNSRIMRGLQGLVDFASLVHVQEEMDQAKLQSGYYKGAILPGGYLRTKGKLISTIPRLIVLLEMGDDASKLAVLQVLSDLEEKIIFATPQLMDLADTSYKELRVLDDRSSMTPDVEEGLTGSALSTMIIVYVRMIISSFGYDVIPILESLKYRYADDDDMRRLIEDIILDINAPAGIRSVGRHLP